MKIHHYSPVIIINYQHSLYLYFVGVRKQGSSAELYVNFLNTFRILSSPTFKIILVEFRENLYDLSLIITNKKMTIFLKATQNTSVKNSKTFEN